VQLTTKYTMSKKQYWKGLEEIKSYGRVQGTEAANEFREDLPFGEMESYCRGNYFS
jgi:MoCo/4Fe-4S cofactor protein with predicted Tat translocation signal